MATLLPFKCAEDAYYVDLKDLDRLRHCGYYPRVHDQRANPAQAHADYFESHVERDLCQIAAIRDRSWFLRIVKEL